MRKIIFTSSLILNSAFVVVYNTWHQKYCFILKQLKTRSNGAGLLHCTSLRPNLVLRVEFPSEPFGEEPSKFQIAWWVTPLCQYNPAFSRYAFFRTDAVQQAVQWEKTALWQRAWRMEPQLKSDDYRRHSVWRIPLTHCRRVVNANPIILSLK